VQIVAGRKTEELGADAFRALAVQHRLTLLDIGSGDGAFPYRVAGTHADVLCVGVDPNRDGLAEYAAKARHKPARGGRSNVLYIAAAVEALPDELAAAADLITINFPWASLLSLILNNETTLTAALRHVARDPWALQILLNAEAPPPPLDIELGVLTAADVRTRLDPALGSASVSALPDAAHVGSRWGGRLIRGSDRTIIRVRADFGAVPAEYGALLDAAVGLE